MTSEKLKYIETLAIELYKDNPGITDEKVLKAIALDMKAGFDPDQQLDQDGQWSTAPGSIQDRPCFKKWFADSKTVDEDGNPIVLSHGGLGQITEFSDGYAGQTTADNPHGAFYFSNQKEVAVDYSIQAFNRMYQDNPEGLVYDGILKSIPDFDGYDEQYAFVDELAYENINVVNAFIRMENPMIIDADYQNLRELEKRFNVQSAIGIIKGNPVDEWPEEFYDLFDENGEWIDGTPDGLIIKNVIDDIGDRSNMYQDVYIATDPGQIKSTTAESFCHESNINKNFKAGFDPNQPRDESGQWGKPGTPEPKKETEINDKFKASKMRDENGDLIVFYHGAPEYFDEFDPLKQNEATGFGDFGKGFYFTGDRGIARLYARKSPNGVVLKTFLNIANPFVVDLKSEKLNSETAQRYLDLVSDKSEIIKEIVTKNEPFTYKNISKAIGGDEVFTNILLDNNFDGVIVNRTRTLNDGSGPKDDTLNFYEVVTFDPEQSEIFDFEKYTHGEKN